MLPLFRLLVVGSLIFASGCGLKSPTLQTEQATVKAQESHHYKGTYLAVTFDPSAEVEADAARLRSQLGFLDLSHAIPPRTCETLHVTIGYFQSLDPQQAQELTAGFRGKQATITLDGYGVYNKQCAYFSVKGIDEARRILSGKGIRFTCDDPHVTFGVCPANPRDAHGVPKKAQKMVGPYAITGEYHFMQGSKIVW